VDSPAAFLEGFDAFVLRHPELPLYRYAGYRGGSGALLIRVKGTESLVVVRPWLRARAVGLADIVSSDERYRVFKRKRANIHVHVAALFRENAVRHAQSSRALSLVVLSSARDEVDVIQSGNIPQAVVEALQRFCTEQGLRATYGFSDRFDLHPRVATASAELLRGAHYRNAVHDAALGLINYVKEKSGRHDLDGAGLMTTVFSKNSPILAFNRLTTQTERDEQEGFMHLFIGVVLAIRNPRSHDLLPDERDRAMEYLRLLSLLARRVDFARVIRRTGQRNPTGRKRG
jgi:uncharacterized protein (TIGR02391 family)